MRNLFRSPVAYGAIAFAALAAALVSCNSNTVAPAGPAPVTVPQVQFPAIAENIAIAVPTPRCSPAALPGTYTNFNAFGTVKGTTFTFNHHGSVWERGLYTVGKGTPAPGPTPPAHQKVYIYQGTFTLTRNGVVDTKGCATVIASQDGSPLKISGAPIGSNGFTTASPRFATHIGYRIGRVGAVTSLLLTGLSASGGKGTVSLDDGSKGTITLVRRLSYP